MKGRQRWNRRIGGGLASWTIRSFCVCVCYKIRSTVLTQSREKWSSQRSTKCVKGKIKKETSPIECRAAWVQVIDSIHKSRSLCYLSRNNTESLFFQIFSPFFDYHAASRMRYLISFRSSKIFFQPKWKIERQSTLDEQLCCIIFTDQTRLEMNSMRGKEIINVVNRWSNNFH